jgi:hypothetical protein
MQAVQRRTVDLSAYPDLCVVMLGLRIRSWRGILATLKIGPGLNAVAKDWPDGLLADERVIYGWGHFGMRQYWRDLESLERFTRSEPHAIWWRDFLKRYNGAGFWHETYSRSGKMEAVYLDTGGPVGFARFAAAADPVGPLKSLRKRLDASAVPPDCAAA